MAVKARIGTGALFRRLLLGHSDRGADVGSITSREKELRQFRTILKILYCHSVYIM